MFCRENITHFLKKKMWNIHRLLQMYSQNDISQTTTIDNISWLLKYKINIETTPFNIFSGKSMGSPSNDDGDGNEKGKKAIGLD